MALAHMQACSSSCFIGQITTRVLWPDVSLAETVIMAWSPVHELLLSQQCVAPGVVRLRMLGDIMRLAANCEAPFRSATLSAWETATMISPGLLLCLCFLLPGKKTL